MTFLKIIKYEIECTSKQPIAYIDDIFYKIPIESLKQNFQTLFKREDQLQMHLSHQDWLVSGLVQSTKIACIGHGRRGLTGAISSRAEVGCEAAGDMCLALKPVGFPRSK